MSNEQPLILTIFGRHYRFKDPANKLPVLTQAAIGVDARLTELAKDMPQASRDQLLMLALINVVGELNTQQHLTSQQLQALLAVLAKADC